MQAAAGESAFDIPAAPILIPPGPWKEIDGSVTAPKGFKAQGVLAMVSGLPDMPCCLMRGQASKWRGPSPLQ